MVGLDLQIKGTGRGGVGGASKKIVFGPSLRVSVWSKNKGGAGVPGPRA